MYFLPNSQLNLLCSTLFENLWTCICEDTCIIICNEAIFDRGRDSNSPIRSGEIILDPHLTHRLLLERSSSPPSPVTFCQIPSSKTRC
ncbi:hypothetical protein RJT34_25861 [Clitoria ternatea]|uniref:Uncharacterized protein n=1 Tax=Clitoria ternatea TaxID=43366 RepID=A0AAN9IJ57_CLITE